LIDKLKCDESTIVVGHSFGASATMRLLQEHSLAGAVLVSPRTTSGGSALNQATGLYPRDEAKPELPVDGGAWHWGAIRKNTSGNLAVIHSNDDPLIRLDEPRIVAEQLGVHINIQWGASNFQMPCEGIYHAADRAATNMLYIQASRQRAKFQLTAQRLGAKPQLSLTMSKESPDEKLGVILERKGRSGSLVVHTVRDGSITHAAGVRAGDVVLKINGEAAPTKPSEATALLKAATGKIQLTVERDIEDDD
jgi:predicted alpha/beta hydrolase family esterase